MRIVTAIVGYALVECIMQEKVTLFRIYLLNNANWRWFYLNTDFHFNLILFSVAALFTNRHSTTASKQYIDLVVPQRWWFWFYERLQFFSEKSKIDKSGSAHFRHEKLQASLMLSHAVGYYTYTIIRHLFTQWYVLGFVSQ